VVRSLRSSDAAFAWTAHPRRYGYLPLGSSAPHSPRRPDPAG